MKTSPSGLAFIKSWEALFLQAYDDATEKIVRPGQGYKGTLTIGYGHTDEAGPPEVTVGMMLKDEAQASAILLSDLAPVEKRVSDLVKVPLNQNQADALVSFQFNCGWLTHPHCSLLAALNAGRYELADEDFMLYDRAQGKVLMGLDRRRAAEKKLFLTPMEKDS